MPTYEAVEVERISPFEDAPVAAAHTCTYDADGRVDAGQFYALERGTPLDGLAIRSVGPTSSTFVFGMGTDKEIWVRVTSEPTSPRPETR